MSERMSQWQDALIGGWNNHGWMVEPERVGDRIARLIGASIGSVTVGDTLSIRLYQALAAALSLQQQREPSRRRVLTDSGNFPSDLYIARGLLATLGDGYELVVVEPEEIAASIDETVAVLMLTEVDYRSARRHDMYALSARARSSNVLTVWDLAHSAGALAVDVQGADVDFAVGCTYKFLNGGPGAPAFLYAAPRLEVAHIPRAISGWLGHAAPFAFETEFRASPGIESFRIGTPSVLAMRVLDTALDAFDGVDMIELEKRAAVLSQRLIDGVMQHCPSLSLAGPRDPQQRGSHVSFSCDTAYPVMQCLIRKYRVIGDVRAPNLLRFGITPLYIDESDIDRCIEVLAEVLDGGLWDRAEFHQRQAVT